MFKMEENKNVNDEMVIETVSIGWLQYLIFKIL